MKQFLTKDQKSAISLSCNELAGTAFFEDRPVFSETLDAAGIAVTLCAALPPIADEDGLPVLEIPPCRDLDARRDYAAACAFVFCSSQGLGTVGLRLSEERVQTLNLADARRTTEAALVSLFETLSLTADTIRQRAKALAALRFPFSSLREGQKTLMRDSYAAMRDGKSLFALAPTGIGKTLSVLYPALKALEKGHLSKVFYLTPHGSLQPQIAESLLFLQGETPFLHSITLFAKARLCAHKLRCAHERCEKREASRSACRAALGRLFAHAGHITPDAVKAAAEECGVCPFELALDASYYCEVILCDYNYIFDPHASLKRYRGAHDRYALLVDEAHNLVLRVRESFSAYLAPQTLAPLEAAPMQKFENIGACAALLMEALLCLRKTEGEAFDPISFSPPDAVAEAAQALCDALFPLAFQKVSDLYSAQMIDTAREAFFALKDYLNAHADFDAHYAVCLFGDGGVKLSLVDPSQKVREIVESAGMAIFFSATLSPPSYYLGMLGGSEDDFLDLPSPFDSAHLKIITAPISTLYNDRERTAHAAAQLIRAATLPRVGNYMVFFPSFEYLDRVVKLYRELCPRDLILCQKRQMNERERAQYLAAFQVPRRQRLLGFAVMGGLFSEGVDLVGDRLLGELIFGVGMPPPCVEAEAVRRRFDDRDEDGHALGYTLPGFNRVLQSAGRVIRTEEDRGFLVLCDERYETPAYETLFPAFWEKPVSAADPQAVEALVTAFWKEQGILDKQADGAYNNKGQEEG